MKKGFDCLYQISRIAAISPDQTKSRDMVAYSFQYKQDPITLLNIPVMNDHGQNQTQSVNDYMAFAVKDLLARVAAAQPPFSVVLALWLSMIPKLGIGFLPALRRAFLQRI
jgi:hypothetical protein